MQIVLDCTVFYNLGDIEQIKNSRYSAAMRYRRLLLYFMLFFLFYGKCLAQSGNEIFDTAAVKKTFPVSAFIGFSLDTVVADVREYVFKNRHILSELKWPLIPSLSYTLHCGLFLPKGIHIEGSIGFMQIMRSGTMVDRDFEEIVPLSQQPKLTKYSEHLCNIIGGLRSTVKVGLQLPVPQTTAMQRNGITLMLEPMIGVRYSNIRWYSYDGYLQYARKRPDGSYEMWNKDLPKIPFTGPAVSYKQELIAPSIGVGIEASFPRKIRLTADVHLTSDIIAAAEDVHYSRKLRFVDIMNGGWALYAGTRISWRFLPYCALFGAVVYEYGITKEGATIVYNGLETNSPYAYTPFGSAGTSLHGAVFSAGFAFMLWR